MAADILAHHATHVPVGEDQKQHVEFDAGHRGQVQPRFRRGVLSAARADHRGAGDAGDVAARRVEEDVEVDPSDQSRINLTDDADTIAWKIRRARTDP